MARHNRRRPNDNKMTNAPNRNAHLVGSGSWWRLGVLAGFVGAATVAALVVDLPSVARIQELTSRAGPFGVAGFALGYALLTLGPVPKVVMSAAAGLLFGWVPGALVVWVASLLGALGGFWLGRWLGRGAVERVAGTRMGGLMTCWPVGASRP